MGAYSDFEYFMYQNNTVFIDNQYLRGQGTYNETRFMDYPEEKKDVVCRIPLSQPVFLGTILLIWTLTCVGDIQNAAHTFWLFGFKVPRTDSMDTAIRHHPHGGYSATGVEKIITGLTCDLKILICVLICLPRLLIVMALLWIGSRWLTATPDFEDMVLNGIALEFVLLTRELLFRTVVSTRSKIDVRSTRIATKQSIPVAWSSFLGAFAWLIVSIIWVVIYVRHTQNVIPYYGKDIALVCDEWLHSLKAGRQKTLFLNRVPENSLEA